MKSPWRYRAASAADGLDPAAEPRRGGPGENECSQKSRAKAHPGMPAGFRELLANRGQRQADPDESHSALTDGGGRIHGVFAGGAALAHRRADAIREGLLHFFARQVVVHLVQIVGCDVRIPNDHAIGAHERHTRADEPCDHRGFVVGTGQTAAVRQ
ncbi:MAG: hypothetical protein IPL75_11585 [Acidobacteria bacterium]|nr:hypothetical protein [Acidobacteriota bacterium]